MLAYWVHDLDPFAIRFTDTFGLRWYGLSYAAGFIVALLLMRLYWKRGRSPLAPPQIDTLFMALFLGVFLGGRLGYMLLYNLEEFLRDPATVVRVWQGGMASHGGFIGVFLALCWAARHFGISLRSLGDIVTASAPPGLFFGRIANFINGELWGHPSSVPWAVVFPDAPLDRSAFVVEVAGLGLANPRHPSQLYEAVLEGLVLFAYLQHRLWRNRLNQRVPGQLAGEFLVGYALARIVGELFRVPDASLILGLSRGTFYSVLTLLLGIGVILWARAKSKAPGESVAAAG